MNKRAAIAVLLALWASSVLAQSLTLTWHGPVLRVERGEGCLVLTGNNLPPRHLSDVDCSDSPVELKATGVDYAFSPVGRTLELREAVTNLLLASAPVPDREYRQILPLVAN